MVLILQNIRVLRHCLECLCGLVHQSFVLGLHEPFSLMLGLDIRANVGWGELCTKWRLYFPLTFVILSSFSNPSWLRWSVCLTSKSEKVHSHPTWFTTILNMIFANLLSSATSESLSKADHTSFGSFPMDSSKSACISCQSANWPVEARYLMNAADTFRSAAPRSTSEVVLEGLLCNFLYT